MFGRKELADIGSMNNCIRPKIGSHSRVAMSSEGKTGAGRVTKVLNTALSNTILMMSTNTAESDALTTAANFITKTVRGKNAIIGMIMLNTNAMKIAKLFECLFGRNGIIG